MTQTYTIKNGDTLLGIAVSHQVDFNQLLDLNPQYQPNPGFIKMGATVQLPDVSEPEVSVEPINPISPPQPKRPLCDEGALSQPPQCKGTDIKDVLFFTEDKGKKNYYCLDEKSQQFLEEEITYTEQLMQGYKQLLDNAPDPKSATEKEQLQHAQKKKQWAEEAINAGAISFKAETTQIAGVSSTRQSDTNQQMVLAKLTELEKRRRFVQVYRPPFLNNEDSIETLKKQVLKSIEQDIETYKKLDRSTPTPQSPTTTAANLDNLAHSKTLTTTPARRHVMEVFSVQRNRLVYVRIDYVERERRHWRQRSIDNKDLSALRSGKISEFKEALLKDIKEGISQGINNPSIEGIIKEWKADGGHTKEWKATHYILDDDGETRFAASAEAQLFRWGASASVKSTFEPKIGGRVDIGIGAQASFSLAEAAVKFESFLPYEAGFPLSLTYRDANKQIQQYSFGRFRTKATVIMSCFAGVMGSATASVSNQAQEQPAGHSMLLSPAVSMGEHNGRVGVKAEGFAGAQVGGQLTGGVEWLNPEKENTVNFDSLAEVKLEGNVAIGAGFGADFSLELDGSTLMLYCHGRIVWGPGGSGGFGTSINFEQLWELAQVIWQGLQYIDYRQLENVNADMYKYLLQSSYMAFVLEPIDSIQKSITSGATAVDKWLLTRQSQKQEAKILTQRILTSETWSGVKPDKLQPETIGMMLDTLVETFIDSWEEDQERAICYLLGTSVHNWRKFEEILSRMNAIGKKEAGDNVLFINLARINGILDNDVLGGNNQQEEFNQWGHWLAQQNNAKEVAAIRGTELPFTPLTGYAFNQKKRAVTTQLAHVSSGTVNGRYV